MTALIESRTGRQVIKALQTAAGMSPSRSTEATA